MKQQGFFYDPEKDKPKRRRKLKRRKVAEVLNPCEQCGLYKEVETPKLEPHGKFRKKILVLGEAPGEQEDYEGEPFRGKVGKWFRPYFTAYDLNMERDCITLNACDCRPTEEGKNGLKNRAPTKKEIRYCYHRKQAAYEKYKPRVIFLLGKSAIDSFYGQDPYRRAGVSTDKGLLGLDACAW
jgi:DNA polymerase